MTKETRNAMIIGSVGAVILALIIVTGVKSIKNGRAEFAQTRMKKQQLADKIKWEEDAPKRAAREQRIKEQEEAAEKEYARKARKARNKARSEEVNGRYSQQKTQKDRIESQFSSWDGSHRNFTKLIKSIMNDPKSYKHVETVYWTNNKGIKVTTTFRGSNAFGGIVTNTKSALYTIDGELVLFLN